MSFKRENSLKRSVVDLIDLTGDDDEIPPFRKKKLPWKETRQKSATPVPSMPGSFVIEDDDDNIGDEIMYMGTQTRLDDGPRELYGTMAGKIVGIQHYKGMASAGEAVRLIREPHNRFDRNAIRVENIFGEMIGHISKGTASQIARFMDENSLTIDARLLSNKGTYDVPVELSFFGPIDRERKYQLAMRLKSDGVKIQQLEFWERQLEARRREEIAMATQMASPFGDGSSQLPYRRLEDIIAESGHHLNPREVGQYAEKFGMSEEDLQQLPAAEGPRRLETKLLAYQQQGLSWLQDRESPKFPRPGSDEAVQLWKVGRGGIYENIATRIRTTQEPKLASGGILADDMGLGKTIQIIALIVADLEKPANDSARTTLVVAPLSLLSNWSNQIAQHVNSKKPLRVFTYHGANKKKVNKPADFARYDVVLTTYGAIAAEFEIKSTKDQEEYVRSTGIFSNIWRRIVLDEGHSIRNPSTRTSRSCRAVRAASHWCLTGTPIVNSLTDLCSILAFVGITGGLEQLSIFNSVLTNPVKQQNETAIALLQAVMAQFTLRRKKEFKFVNLKLPKITHTVLDVEFNKKERGIHDTFSASAKSDLRDWKELRQGDREDRRAAAQAYRHLFEVLLRLRQTCNHWKLCGSRATQMMELLANKQTVEFTPENIEALKDMMKLAVEGEDDCPICMDTITLAKNPVITTCGHIFCKNDIVQVIQGQGKCPMCRQSLNMEGSIVELSAADYDKEDKLLANGDENDEEDEDENSSKVKALMELLQSKQHEENPKIVLFSQWTSFLTLLEPHLREAGLKYTRLDGTMSVAQRDQALKLFDADSECTILLASLAVASVGLNLVVANTVILSDSWWAPSIEDQAVDRIYRLGQKRECSVFKLVVKDSIEQRVLAIQEEKRLIMRSAFNEGEDGVPRRREQGRMRDLERLLE